MGIFVYHPDASDLSTTGLIGDLQAIECTFEEQRNGVSRLNMQLAYDTHEKWRAVEKGCLIKAPVLSRVPPVFSGNALASSVNEYSLATNAARVFLYLRDGTKWAEVPQWYRSESTLKFYRIGDEKTINGAAMVQVFVVLPFGTGWVNCTGYIRKDMLSSATSRNIPQTINGLEAVTEASRLSYQLFTVVDTEETLGAVIVSCEHIFYDLATNYTEWTPAENTEYTGAQACAQVMANLFSPDDQFSVRSDAVTAMRGSRIDVVRKNAVESFLDPERGVCALYGLSAIRDNYDVYLIENAETDRGFVVEYAKNMLGVQRNEGIKNVVTRTFPFGHDSNGEIIWLDGTRYIDSQYVSRYRRPRAELFDTGLTIGKDGVTEDNILSKIRQEGQKRFTVDHADLPELSMTVEFISLGDTEEYVQYRGLDRVYQLDRIAVRDKVRGYQYSAQVIGIKYNVLKEILESVVIGTVANWNGARKIARWQVPEISGDNIRLKSILAGSFDIGAIQGDDIAEGGVLWVHIAAASISQLTTEQLEALTANIHTLIAGSITAEDITAGSITAEEIASGAITADKIDAGAVTAQKIAAGAINADKIDTDAIEAINAKLGIARIAQAEIGSASIGFAQIVDASITQLIAQDAVTDRYYIDKLAVRSAQMVQATVGELIVKAADGNYYKLTVAADGSLTTTRVTLTAGEISAGVTSDGHSSIIETDLTVADLSASNMKAINALIDKLTASRIDVDELFARQATINKINALDITSNTYLQMMVDATYVQWTDPATEAGNIVHDGDIWYKTAPTRTHSQMAAYKHSALATYTYGGLEASQQYYRKNNAWVLFADVAEIEHTVASILMRTNEISISVDNNAGDIAQIKTWLSGISLAVSDKYDKVSGITITADGIDLSGSQYVRIASGGYFSVQTGNFGIDTESDNYVIWSGAAAAASASFSVKKDGTLYATAGTIGGWTIGASAIYNGTSSMSSNTQGLYLGTNGIRCVGATNMYIFNFSKTDGRVIIKAGMSSVSDTTNNGMYIDSNNGIALGAGKFKVTLAGALTATSGNIAGWSIGTNALYKGSGSSAVYLNADTTTTGTKDYAIWVGGDLPTGNSAAPFRVKRDGTVYLTQLIAVGENGTESTVNLRTAGLWKLSYSTVKSHTSNSITLSNGDVVNFNTAASVTLDTSYGSGSGLTYNSTYASYSNDKTHITVTAWLTNGTSPSGTLNITDRAGSGLAYDAGWVGCYGTVGLNSTAATTLEYGASVTVYAQAKATSTASSKTNVESRTITAPPDVDFASPGSWSNGVRRVTLTNNKATNIYMPTNETWNGTWNDSDTITVKCTAGGKTYTHTFSR